VTVAAVMLGLAAATKNEGLTLIVAAAMALLICRRTKDIVRLWPAVAIAAPWLMVRALHRLPTDIAAGSVFSRIADHLAQPAPLIDALEHASVGKPLMWIGLLLGALLVGYYEGDDFVFAGRIGTGFDTTLLLDLRAKLDAIAIPESPFTKGTGLPRLGAHWARQSALPRLASRGRPHHSMRSSPATTLWPQGVPSWSGNWRTAFHGTSALPGQCELRGFSVTPAALPR